MDLSLEFENFQNGSVNGSVEKFVYLVYQVILGGSVVVACFGTEFEATQFCIKQRSCSHRVWYERWFVGQVKYLCYE